MKSEYCGYCFYNNVALAAREALDNRGVKRVLIVDWDIHHGQATQQQFYDDPRYSLLECNTNNFSTLIIISTLGFSEYYTFRSTGTSMVHFGPICANRIIITSDTERAWATTLTFP